MKYQLTSGFFKEEIKAGCDYIYDCRLIKCECLHGDCRTCNIPLWHSLTSIAGILEEEFIRRGGQ